MHKVLVLAAAAALCVGMAACGGGDTPQTLAAGAGSGGSSGGSGGTGGTGGTGGGTTTPTYSMGNGSGSSFQSGIIGITGLPTGSQLSAGGTASLTVSVVDQNGALYTGSTVNINFNSTCIGQGLALITPTGTTTAGTNPGSVATTSGIANVSYTAKGCATTDVITATATVAAANLSATGSISVASATAGSIQFVSATPSSIGLKGTGLGETSTVIFKVVDSTGGPVSNVAVTFALSTPVGGLGLAPASGTTGADGTVKTVVSSGTQHTAIRVVASMTSPALTTQSSLLSVTTGLPASDTFSISVGSASYGQGGVSNPPACPNVETFNLDQVTIPVTVSLADRYGNPAPDGTAVAFTTNGGKVGGSCATPLSTPNDGSCKVTWTSANPRPTPGSAPPTKAAGRVTILATAIGEETFDDQNGNGYYDSGEPFTNLGEPYRDDNENGAYEVGEYFLDFDHNQTRDPPSGTFKGISCTGNSPSSTCTTTSLAIGTSHLIVMTTGQSVITAVSATGGTLGGSANAPTLTLTHGQGFSLTFNVADANGNPAAAGSTINVSADSSAATISSNSGAFTYGCSVHQGGDSFQSFGTAASAAGSGNLTILVTSAGTKTLTPLTIPVTVN